MREGYTTGTCAQAAAGAAMLMLAYGKPVSDIEVETASGRRLKLDVIGQMLGRGFARCGIIKDSGDDHDITNGAEIHAEVRLSPGEGIRVKGGRGVGTVTKPGLAVPPGEPAINPIPMQMILKEVSANLPPGQKAEVTIIVPRGEELAAKTYNARVGVLGGISILGTSGIVEPRSLEAYRATLALQVRVARASGLLRLALCPGYLGERFCVGTLGLPREAVIRTGDHIGFVLEECRESGLQKVLLVGHLGKLVKVAAGIFNTHHAVGDARMETIAAYAALQGATREVIAEIMKQDSAEATVAIIGKHGLTPVFDRIAERVVERAFRLLAGGPGVECFILDLKGEVLGQCPVNKST